MRIRHVRRARPAPAPRRGAVVVVVIVVILLIALVSGSILQLTLMQRRQIRREVQQRQSAWLAESARSRVLAQLAVDADYNGEEWTISEAELPGGSSARVEIRREDSGQFVVIADYPDDSVDRRRVRRTLTPPVAADPAEPSN